MQPFLYSGRGCCHGGGQQVLQHPHGQQIKLEDLELIEKASNQLWWRGEQTEQTIICYG